MDKDDRDILDLLKFELEFLEKGGYGRSVKTPHEATSVFTDSPTCFSYPTRAHDDCCLLTGLVPAEARGKAVPCHYIPLNEAGETIADLEDTGDQVRMEEALKTWLRKTIKRIEDERAAAAER
jgi:hypothetical protein